MPASALFSWHLQDRAFERLTPPWLDVTVKGGPKRLSLGLIIDLVVKKYGISINPRFKITDLETDKKFIDQQISGPFATWKHEHIFEALPDGRSVMHDAIKLGLPFGFLTEPLASGMIESDLKRMFRYRHEILKYDLACLMKNREAPRQNILLFGAWSGLSEELLNFLKTQGHIVEIYPGEEIIKDQLKTERELATRLGRGDLTALICMAPFCSANQWEIDMRRMFIEAINGSGRKRSIYVDLHVPHTGKCYLDTWEQYCSIISSRDSRTIFVHTGEVLTPKFGVLQDSPDWSSEALARERAGASIPAWIGIDDAVAALEFCLIDENVAGKVAVAAPHAVVPDKNTRTLESFGYEFRYAQLDRAIKHVLGL